jgi:hypothetical protein
MDAKKRLLRLATFVVCCCGAVGLSPAKAQAEQGLRPERPPGTVGAPLRPDPAPSALAPETSTVSSSPTSSSSYAPPASSESSRQVAPSVPASSSVPSAPAHAVARASERRASRSPAPRHFAGRPSWAWWPWRGAVSAFGSAQPTASPEASIPLLAAGLALLVLVIGEATFLGLAANLFGVPARRLQASRRPSDAPFPIRQVFPRR